MPDLVVIREFADHKRGDRITDAAQIKEILEGEEAAYVVQAAPPPPPPVAGPNSKQLAPGAAAPTPTVQQTAPEPVIEHNIPEPTEAAPQPITGATVSVTRESAPTPPSAS